LGLDGGPSPEQFAAIRALHPHRTVVPGSKTERWSWARHQAERTLNLNFRPPYTETQGRREPWSPMYRRALEEALALALRPPAALAPSDLNLPSAAREILDRLDAEFRVFRDDAAIRSELYVRRTVEGDVTSRVETSTKKWCYAIVGEAGCGKSTLLWSLYRALQAESGFTPILISASWFHHSTLGSGRIDSLLSDLDALVNLNVQPLILLDTIDLLLQDDESRIGILRFLSAVQLRDIGMLLASRPHEAELLPRNEVIPIHLKPYDDAELRTAAAKLAAHHCHAAEVTVVVADLPLSVNMG